MIQRARLARYYQYRFCSIKKEGLKIQEQVTKTNEQEINQQLRNFIFRYIVPSRNMDQNLLKSMVFQNLYSGVNKLFFYGGPWCMKMGINSLNSPLTIHQAPFYFIGYGLCYSSQVFFEGLRNYEASKISQLALKDISIKTYDHLLNMDNETHLQSSHRANIFSIYRAQKAIENNLKSVNQFFVPMMLDVALTSALLLNSFGFPFVCTFVLTHFSYALFTVKYSNVKRNNQNEYSSGEKALDRQRLQKSRHFQISLQLNILTQKSLNCQGTRKFLMQISYSNLSEIGFYVNVQHKHTFYIKQWSKNNFISRPCSKSTFRCSFSLGRTTNSRRYSFFTSFNDLNELFAPLFFFGVIHREWSESLLDIKDLFRVLSRTPTIKEAENAQEFIYKQGDIRLENVSFCFGTNKQILTNQSLHIKGGEWVMISGESGVGKSTLFNLIFRLIDPQEGQIFLDDQPLKELKLNSFRSLIGVVSQHSYLFNDSIRNNLMYGCDLLQNMTPQQIQQKEEEMRILCDRLGLGKIINNLPDGYNTNLGEQAGKFSGGERQRLQIVRCLLRGARILLLDEPTSALDAKNERKFMKTLEQIVKEDRKLTVLIITHRMHLATQTDKVLYMGKQNNIEFGSQNDLIIANKGYAKAWKKYIQSYEVSEH